MKTAFRIFGTKIRKDRLLKEFDIEEMKQKIPIFMQDFLQYLEKQDKKEENSCNLLHYMQSCEKDDITGITAAIAIAMSEALRTDVIAESDAEHEYVGFYCTMPWAFDDHELRLMYTRAKLEISMHRILALFLEEDASNSFDFFSIIEDT